MLTKQQENKYSFRYPRLMYRKRPMGFCYYANELTKRYTAFEWEKTIVSLYELFANNQFWREKRTYILCNTTAGLGRQYQYVQLSLPTHGTSTVYVVCPPVLLSYLTSLNCPLGEEKTLSHYNQTSWMVTCGHSLKDGHSCRTASIA